MSSILLKLITITLIFLISYSPVFSKKMITNLNFKNQLKHSSCYEIIQQKHQNFRIRSTKYIGSSIKTLDLFIKIKIICENLVSARYEIDNWKLNGKLIGASPVFHSIEGTDCFTVTSFGLSITKQNGLLNPKTNEECNNLMNKVFSIKLSTEYTEPLECSTVGSVKIHDIMP